MQLQTQGKEGHLQDIECCTQVILSTHKKMNTDFCVHLDFLTSLVVSSESLT